MSSNKIKILFYTDTPLYGGAERQLFLLIKYLNHSIYEPVLVSRKTSALEKWAEDCRNLGIKVHQINSRSKHSLSNYFQLKKIVQTEQPDILHGQIWNPMAGKYLFLLKKSFDIPLVITEHDPFPLNFPKAIYKKWANNLADQIICVSKANQKLLTELYPNLKNKIQVIYNGIESNSSSISAAQKAMIRTQTFQLPPNSKTKIIFSAGTLHKRKGFQFLLPALTELEKNVKNFKLVIAGEGPEHQNLLELSKNLGIENKILLLGQREDVDELMSSADLFVLPSLKEAFGLVILEAMHAGLPIVASKVGGIPEILGENYNLLCPAQDSICLSKKISQALQKPETIKSFIDTYPTILEKFSAQSTAEQTALIYHNLLSNQISS